MSGEAIDTILAFDFGLKRIGVAIGNTMICPGQAARRDHGDRQ